MGRLDGLIAYHSFERPAAYIPCVRVQTTAQQPPIPHMVLSNVHFKSCGKLEARLCQKTWRGCEPPPVRCPVHAPSGHDPQPPQPKAALPPAPTLSSSGTATASPPSVDAHLDLPAQHSTQCHLSTACMCVNVACINMTLFSS
jgi:hypothetical protein